MIAFTPTSDRADCATGSDTPTGRHTASGAGSSGTRLDPAEHYVGMSVISAAIAWHDAATDDEVDRASSDLHAAVKRYLRISDELSYAHRLLDQAVGQ